MSSVTHPTHPRGVTQGAGAAVVELTWLDGCTNTFPFLYYPPPMVLAVTPTFGPRFGSTAVTVYATNVVALKDYGARVSPVCSFGQADGLTETGSAQAWVKASITGDGTAVTCPTPPTNLTQGVWIVRLSLNGQQFSLPAVESIAPAPTVSFAASGPTLRLVKDVVHGAESAGRVSIEVRRHESFFFFF